MVLSGSIKTSSISSITNQKTFGGDKKYGLQYSVGRSAWSNAYFNCRGLPKSLAYGASKSAMINLCEGIYPELKANNIALSIINPGFVKTRLTAKNNFPMPFLISQEQASDYIYQGLMTKKFEIHFPKKFTFILKFLRIIPYKLYLPIINNIYRKNLK